MPFRNENTYYWAIANGDEDEFNSRYEEAYRELMETIDDHPTNYPNIIGGEDLASEEWYDDTSPSDTSLVLGRFPRASKEEVRRAVNSAKNEFPSWSHRGYPARVEIMEQAARIIRDQKFHLAAVLTLDNGKNRFEAVADVDEAIDFLMYYSEQMRTNHGFCHETPAPFPEEYTKLIMRPYGVWAVICPFNFPVAITTGMAAGALITGNTVVLKPSSSVPLPVYIITRLMHEAGVPGGALNFISTPGSIAGEALISNPDVSGMVFTGSREVGFSILRNSVLNQPRPVIAEMGGKNPIIVSSKANLDWAIEGSIRSAFGYSGQKCSACSRLYVQADIYEAFLADFVRRTKELLVGDPSIKEVNLGPVIDKKAYDSFKESVKSAKREGQILAGGDVLAQGGLEKGYFVQPTAVVGLPEDHPLVKKELFLPFVCVQKFDSLEDAIRMANDVEYGLTAGIFTDSDEEVEYFFKNIQAGVVYSNRIKGGSTGAMVGGQPFGGWKASGSTGKGAGGPHYLLQFLKEQSRTMCEN